MKKIVILGAGAFAREVLELINQINLIKPTWDIIGFVDDFQPVGTIISNKPVLGGLSYLNENLEGETAVVLAIGNPNVKEMIISKLISPFIFYPVLIHPNVVLPLNSSEYSIGEGSIICSFTFVSVAVTIGKHVLININCTIGHDAQVGDYSCLMPNVNVSGDVILGDRTYCGVGSKIINKVKVVSDVTIGAGSVVLKNIESSGTLMGVPARMIIKNT